jgi:hypothetical protein
MPQKYDKIRLLVNMGFTEDKAHAAISRCGVCSFDIGFCMIML